MTGSNDASGYPDARVALALVGPALVGLAAFVALPFLIALATSFTDLRLGSPLPVSFVGLEQYRRLFEDAAFWRALLNNTTFSLVVVPLQTSLALSLALLLHRPRPLDRLLRTLFFVPVVFPMALVAVMWTLFYAPGPDGPVNALLETLSFGRWEPRDFLRDGAFALPALIVTSIWQGTGFQMVVFLAALQDVPEELHEAAALDGAGTWGRFRHVTLPGIRNALIFVVVITSILAFRLFDQVRIMTAGGPRGATSTVMFEAVRAAFDRQQMAMGSAWTVVLFAIVLGLTLLQRRLLRPQNGGSA